MEIFDLAVTGADVETPVSVEGEGLTLPQLQEIGLEVGMDPSQIARAAQMVGARQEPWLRTTSMGMPVSIGKVIELPRAVTDQEWDILVSVFREAFGAKGTRRTQGSIREWTDESLHAFLELTGSGHRLRLQERQESARFLNRAGAISLMIAVSLFAILLTTGQSPVVLELGLISSTLLGAGALAQNVVRLPRWARERERQMDDVAGRARALIGERGDDGEPTS